jgi:transposase
MAALYGRLPRQAERNKEAFIDGTYAQAKRGGALVGKSRAGQSTKIMAVADAEGMPIAVAIEEGSRHDVVLVDHVLDQAVTKHLSPILIGDRAFDSKPLAQRLGHERGVRLIAPKRRNKGVETARQDGRHMRRYRRRWKVECLFAFLKQFRRIVVRWESKAENYLAFLYLGCAVILFRQLQLRAK